MAYFNPCCCGETKIGCVEFRVQLELENTLELLKDTPNEIKTKVELISELVNAPPPDKPLTIQKLKQYKVIIVGHPISACGGVFGDMDPTIMNRCIGANFLFRQYVETGGILVVLGEHTSPDNALGIEYWTCQDPTIHTFLSSIGSSMRNNGYRYSDITAIQSPDPTELDKHTLTANAAQIFPRSPNKIYGNLTAHIEGGIPIYTLDNPARYCNVLPCFESNGGQSLDPTLCNCLECNPSHTPDVPPPVECFIPNLSVVVSYAYEKIGKGYVIFQTDSNWNHDQDVSFRAASFFLGLVKTKRI